MKITVIGGGVAGTTTALAVRRATGAEVTVVEAYPEPAGTVGSFLSLAANALRGLESLGCLPAVRAAGFDVPTQRMWGAGGRLLGEVARGRRADDDMHSVTLMRGDLVATLRRAATDAGVRIDMGRRVTSPSEVDGEIVVGADGIWSPTRTHLDPTAEQPRYAGLHSVSGFSPGNGETGVFNMTFAAPGAFLHIGSPDGRIWWSAQVHGDKPAPSLVDLYRDTPHVAEILATATEIGTPIRHHTLTPITRWHDDRVVLVGDAVHPVGAGQGAAMAIEDAVVLAKMLARHGAGREALAAYVAERRDRVAKVLKTAGDNTGAKTAGPLKRRMNEMMMGLFVPRFYERATGWLYDFDPAVGGVGGEVGRWGHLVFCACSGVCVSG